MGVWVGVDAGVGDGFSAPGVPQPAMRMTATIINSGATYLAMFFTSYREYNRTAWVSMGSGVVCCADGFG